MEQQNNINEQTKAEQIAGETKNEAKIASQPKEKQGSSVKKNNGIQNLFHWLIIMAILYGLYSVFHVYFGAFFKGWFY